MYILKCVVLCNVNIKCCAIWEMSIITIMKKLLKNEKRLSLPHVIHHVILELFLIMMQVFIVHLQYSKHFELYYIKCFCKVSIQI